MRSPMRTPPQSSMAVCLLTFRQGVLERASHGPEGPRLCNDPVDILILSRNRRPRFIGDSVET
jgi:hypothetical protein